MNCDWFYPFELCNSIGIFIFINVLWALYGIICYAFRRNIVVHYYIGISSSSSLIATIFIFRSWIKDLYEGKDILDNGMLYAGIAIWIFISLIMPIVRAFDVHDKSSRNNMIEKIDIALIVAVISLTNSVVVIFFLYVIEGKGLLILPS